MHRLHAGELAQALGEGLGLAVRLSVATEPLAMSSLTPAEVSRAEALRGARRHSWLLGRAALKPLVGGGDTASLAFPHRRLSLSHADGLAVAVAVGEGVEVLGVGVDHEPWRESLDLAMAPLFLTEAEQVAATDASTMLRLWTVKEALFKATPGNAENRLHLYDVAVPTALAGDARGPRGERLRFACVELDTGCLTVATCSGTLVRATEDGPH